MYKDFTSIAVPGTLLGATKGGTEFSWGLGVFNIQPDGSLGLIKNHRVVNSCIPTMKVNLMEWTSTTFLGSVPGGNATNETPTGIEGEYLGTGSEITIGEVLSKGTTDGDVDEGTLAVWYTVAATSVVAKATLATDYIMVDQFTFGTIVATDTIKVTDSTGTIKTFLGDDTPVQADGEFETGVTPTSSATSIAALINSAYGASGVTATSAAAIVSLTRPVAGVPNTLTQTGDCATFAYQVVLEVASGLIGNTDLVTASYTYDSSGGTGVYQVLTPGIIAAGDYWDNVTIVCELSNQTYTYPYIVYQIKNCLPAPDPVTIPGDYPGETMLSVLYEGSFDPADGLTMDYAPVEAWLGLE